MSVQYKGKQRQAGAEAMTGSVKLKRPVARCFQIVIKHLISQLQKHCACVLDQLWENYLIREWSDSRVRTDWSLIGCLVGPSPEELTETHKNVFTAKIGRNDTNDAAECKRVFYRASTEGLVFWKAGIHTTQQYTSGVKLGHKIFYTQHVPFLTFLSLPPAVGVSGV